MPRLWVVMTHILPQNQVFVSEWYSKGITILKLKILSGKERIGRKNEFDGSEHMLEYLL